MQMNEADVHLSLLESFCADQDGTAKHNWWDADKWIVDNESNWISVLLFQCW